MADLHGFTLLEERDVPEINSKALLYKHDKTGAELLSIINDDENKCFVTGFATLPSDSTGVAHIMEHSVLAGSRKYPVKEPFVELLKSSLATFINAMTGSDKTYYPVASTNTQDFYNLVDVYMDAIYHPNISAETLKQEGWHYEIDSLDEPLTYKGVVFNEMKGAYSSPMGVLGRYTQQAISPDTIYGHDSGGDPTAIPDLTYEDFRSFYDTYYHPSNARIFFYGDDNPEERLKMMDAYLSEFDAKDIDIEITPQPTFTEPRKTVKQYVASEDGDNKGFMTVSWLLPDPLDLERTFAFQVFEHVLIGTPASPLRKALIDSGLGEDTLNYGLSARQSEMSFSVGMRGFALDNADKIEAMILEALGNLANEGIDKATIEASLNTIEFSLREYNTGGFPRGLAMGIGASMQTWMYGGNPIDPLAYEAPLQAIKTQIAGNDQFFEGMIQEYLLNNTHRSTVILEPDTELGKRLEEAEKARLEEVQSRLTEEALQQLIEETKQLREMQQAPNAPEDLAKIPTLRIADLDKMVKTVPIAVSEESGSTVLYHDLFTNGILYLEVGFDMHALPQEYLPYMSLFGRALKEMGTEKEDFVKLSQRIGSKTGGIGSSRFSSQKWQSDENTMWFMLQGKGTVAQTDDMLDIMRDMLLTTQFDNQERFLQIALKAKAQIESSLIGGGVQYVSNRVKAGFNETSWASDQMGGISYLFFLRDLIDTIQNDWQSVVQKLTAIRDYLFTRGHSLINATIDGDNWQTLQPSITNFINSLPDKAVELQTWQTNYRTGNEGLSAPMQVHYVGMAGNLYDVGYDYHGSMYVATKLVSRGFLWDRIRVQGGAYGGNMGFSGVSGIANFLSWRDPNLVDTIASFKATSEFLRKLDMGDADFEKSIVGAIGTLDQYQLPDAKGYSAMTRYLVGIDDNRRQLTRDEVLSTTQQDLRQLGDALMAMNEKTVIVAMGSRESLEKTNEAHNNLLPITQIL